MRCRINKITNSDALLGKVIRTGNPEYVANTWYFSNLGALLSSNPNRLFESCWDELHPGPPYTSGGPFNKWTYSNEALTIKGTGNYFSRPYYYGQVYRYEGGFVPVTLFSPNFTLPVGLGYSTPGVGLNWGANGTCTWGDISSYGPTAWNRFKPGKNTADLGVFIGEIRDIPRMLYTTAKWWYNTYRLKFGKNPRGKMRNIADQWLNTQFGWLPFLNDLRKFYKTWRNADRLISELIANNGQWVKKGGVVTKGEDSTELWSYNAGSNPAYLRVQPYLEPEFFLKNNAGTAKATRVTRYQVWFEARFRYYVPDMGSVIWKEKALRSLFGGDLTPSVVWELIPWSWLIDWFTNAGDVIANVTNPGLIQNLAAKYAYVMGWRDELIVQTSTLNLVGGSKTLSWQYLLKRKCREQANPFGFGVSWDALTPRQWSILGALGITRLH